jgi:hypothetical protein
MEGHGFYNRASQVQASGASPAVPLFERAAAEVPLVAHPETIVIADYGASEGRNSLVPLGAAVRVLRARAGSTRAIMVVHTDLPTNDFTTLFRTLTEDPGSYLRHDPAVFASAVGRSFYEQLLPDCTVSLGWSSWSVQWLSRTPGVISDTVQVAYSRNAAARAAFHEQSERDWSAFLGCRARELCPGGHLVVLTMGLHDDGSFGYAGVMEAMLGGLEDLVREGLIREAEVRHMVIPTVGRSRKDLERPFVATGRFADLRIAQLEVFDADDRIWSQFERDGDAAAFGARWAAFSRASVFQSLARGLDAGAADPRALAFISALEARMAARLSAKPQKTVIPLAALTLVKDSAV